MLESVTTDLANIQSRLIGMMKSSDAILIGHHICNDLQALKLAHTRCIDTSVIYHNLQRPSAKPSLKWLAQRWLGRTIQAQGQTVADSETGQAVAVLGHRPEEDARACVSLVKMKVEQGIAFGKTCENKTSIFQRIKAAGMSTAYVGGAANSYGTLATTTLDCEEDQVCAQAANSHTANYTITPGSFYAKVLDNVAKLLKTHDFVFGRVHFLADKLGWTTPLCNSSPEPPSEGLPLSRTTILQALDQQLKNFHTSLPGQTAVIVYTGCSDPRSVGTLNKRKAVWDAKMRSGVTADEVPQDERWTAKDMEELDKECEAAKAGLAFFCVSLPTARME
jgi:RNA exonuclease 1